MVIRPSGRQLVLRSFPSASPGSSGPDRDVYATGKLRLCAYSLVTGCSHVASGGFFPLSPTVSSSWNRASCRIQRLRMQARVLGTLPPNTPFHPGHLPAVGWAYIIFDVSIDFIALFSELRTSSLPLISRCRFIGLWCEMLYTHRHGLFWNSGLREPCGSC